MSGKVVGWAMEQRTGSPVAKLVLVKLADNANEDGYCWPSVSLIVEHTELAERTVREHLRKLEAAELISIAPRMSAKGQISNAYQLNVPCVGARRSVVPPAAGAGGRVRQLPGAPARDARDGLRQAQGHKKNRQSEPSLNLPSATGTDEACLAAPPLKGRGDALARLIGELKFATYFSNSELIEGPPPAIVITGKASRVLARLASERFETALHRVFGEEVRVISRDEAERTDARVANADAATGNDNDPRPWWARDG